METYNKLMEDKAMKLNEEQLKSISGGVYIEDLSPEDRAELEKWGAIYFDEKLKNLKNDPGFNQQRLDEAEKKLDELDALFKQKYGN